MTATHRLQLFISPVCYWKGTTCRDPAVAFYYNVSLVQWLNHLFPVTGGIGSRLGGSAPTHTHFGTGIFTVQWSCWVFSSAAKDALRARLTEYSWYSSSMGDVDLQASSKELDSLSPAKMLYGSQQVLPGNFFIACDPLMVNFWMCFRTGFLVLRRSPPLTTLHLCPPCLIASLMHFFLQVWVYSPWCDWTAFDSPTSVQGWSLWFFCLQLVVCDRVEAISIL